MMGKRLRTSAFLVLVLAVGACGRSGDESSVSRATCSTTAPWGGLLGADMNGVKRSGTPGALEACAGADPNGYLA